MSRSTLSDLFAHSAEILLPLNDYIHQQILSSHVICTDDSPVKVKDHSKENNIKTGRIWIYLGDSEHPFNLFDYTTGRGRDGPLKFLEGFNGYLQGDCFSGNLDVCAAIGTVLDYGNLKLSRFLSDNCSKFICQNHCPRRMPCACPQVLCESNAK